MKTKIITLLALLIAMLPAILTAQGYAEIRGVIKTVDYEPVPFALIKVLQGSQLVGGTQADENGAYTVKPLDPGTYEILVSAEGYMNQPVNKIKVAPNQTEYVDVKLAVNTLTEVVITATAIDHRKNTVDKTIFSVKVLEREELIQNSGYTPGDVKGALESITSDVVNTGDGQVHFRGGRGDANAFFVDGVRTLNDSRIPGLAIDQLTVFSGGVPAMYGDVTSGVVIVTTKSYFSGIRDKNTRIREDREQFREEQRKRKAMAEEEKRKREIEEEKSKR